MERSTESAGKDENDRDSLMNAGLYPLRCHSCRHSCGGGELPKSVEGPTHARARNGAALVGIVEGQGSVREARGGGEGGDNTVEAGMGLLRHGPF